MKALITPEDALAAVLDAAQRLKPAAVSPGDCLGCVLAEPIKADRNYPPFDRAMMDGYAVRIVDAGKTVRVAGEVAAGQDHRGQLPAGACVSIMTGAPCPDGTEAVVQKEDVIVRDDRVELPSDIAAERNIVRAGSECAVGDTVIEKGVRVTPLHRALIATFGLQAVSVIPKASVSVIGTGSELISGAHAPGHAQIRSSNAPMLAEFVNASGATCIEFNAVRDTLDSIAETIERSQGDVIVSTGGVSAGNYDLVPKALEALGAELIFHGVEQRPGKPMLFARLGNKLFFGLSGNPMACVVGFNVYVLPALRTLMGFEPPALTLSAEMTDALEGRGTYTWFATGLVSFADGVCRATPMIGRGAADMFTTAGANALLHVPPGATLSAGDAVMIQLMPGCRLDRL